MTMARRRSRLGIFRSALLVLLSLGALAATHAQAEGEWRVEGKKLTTEEAFTGLLAGKTEYSFLIPTSNLTIKCKLKLWVGAVILPSGESNGANQYKECQSFVAGKETPSCNPGTIELKFKSLLILHNGKTYFLFEPRENARFGVIKLGEFCALGESADIKGTYVMACVEFSCETEMVAHSMEPASAELFPSDKLTFGTKAMTFDGTDVVEPGGINYGKLWSA